MCSIFQLIDGLYLVNKLDANKVLTVLTTPIPVNNSDVLLAWVRPTLDGTRLMEDARCNVRGSR